MRADCAGRRILREAQDFIPNVDFYTGLIYQSMGFPMTMFPVLFAIPRMSGWIAQWEELMLDPGAKDCAAAANLSGARYTVVHAHRTALLEPQSWRTLELRSSSTALLQLFPDRSSLFAYAHFLPTRLWFAAMYIEGDEVLWANRRTPPAIQVHADGVNEY